MNFTAFLILITIVCFLLVIVIMVQNPKGGGLSSTFGGGATIGGGVKKTTDFLDKSTWVLGITLIVLILLSSLAFTGNSGSFKTYEEGSSAPASVENLPQAPAADNSATQEEPAK